MTRVRSIGTFVSYLENKSGLHTLLGLVQYAYDSGGGVVVVVVFTFFAERIYLSAAHPASRARC